MKNRKILTLSAFCFLAITLSILTSCSIISNKSKIITIQGAVNRPGDYIVNKPVKFILLLFKAYGYNGNADPKHAVVNRNNKSFYINLDIPANEPPPHLAENFTVYPGDRIFIPFKQNKQSDQSKQDNSLLIIKKKQ